MAIFLVYVDVENEPDLELDGAVFALRPCLHLVDTDATRSRLYHDVKHQLPDDTPLLVAPLTEPPKFKGMPTGALAWVRDGFGSA